MKIKQILNKKALAIFAGALMLIGGGAVAKEFVGSLLGVSAATATYSTGSATGVWTSGSRDVYYSYSNIQISRLYLGSNIAFCVEPAIWGQSAGQSYTDGSFSTDTVIIHSNTSAGVYSGSFTQAQINKMKKIIYYMWTTTNKTDKDYALTQLMIWKAAGWNINVTADSNGYVSDLAGWEAYINNSAPDGYSFNGKSYTFQPGESKDIVDANASYIWKSLNRVTLKRTDGSGNDGWTYSLIKDSNGNASGVRVTAPSDRDSTIKIGGEEQGGVNITRAWTSTYDDRVHQKMITSSGQYIDNFEFTVSVQQATNTRNYRVRKVDPSGNPKSGATFEISDNSNFSNIIATVTTGSDGWTPLQSYSAKGSFTKTFYVREKSAPAGMVKSDEVKQITVTTGSTATAEISYTNRYQDKTFTLKKVDSDGNTVAGVKFKIENPASSTAKEYTTDSNGLITLNDVAYETAQIRYQEVSAPSYLEVDTNWKTANVSSNGATVTASNNFKKTTVKIIKTDTRGGRVQGVVFKVADNANFNNAQTVTTGSDGTITAQFTIKKNSMDVWVKEESAPEHLKISTEVKKVTLTPGNVGEVSFVNELIVRNASVKVVKKDTDGNLVTGVEFEIADNENFNNPTIKRTGNDGSFTVGYSVQGNDTPPTVWIREKTVPSYMIKNDKVEKVQLEIGKTKEVEFVNRFHHSTIKYIKVDERGDRVPGVTFKVSQSSDFTKNTITVETGQDGTVVSRHEIKSDTMEIWIKEESVPDHLVLDATPKKVTLRPNETTEAEFTNKLKTNRVIVEVTKKDADGNTVKGIEFEVAEDENFTKNVTTHTTGESGTFNKTFEVKGNDTPPTVWIREKTVPSYMKKNTKVERVQLKVGEAQRVEFKNDFQETNVKVVKTDERGNRVEGVKFKVADNANFNNAQTITTNAEGVATAKFTIKKESMDVWVKEESVPSHLVLSTDVKKVTLTPNATGEVSFVNDLVTNSAEMKIVKKDTDGRAVQGVVFEIANNEKFENAESATTDNNGTFTKSYIVKGKDTPPTIWVREKTVPQHLKKNAKVEKVQLEINKTKEVEFVNEFQTSNVKIVKRDEAGNFVPGVVFEISTNKDFSGAEMLTTGADGSASKTFTLKSETMPTVYVRERTVPAYLLKSDEVKTVVLQPGGKNEFVYINNFNSADITLKKEDEEGNAVAGVVFEVADNEDFENAEQWTTGEDGSVTKTFKTAQPTKTYWVREVEVPVHLVLSDEVKTLTLAPNSNATVTFVNNLKEYDVKISKRDLSTADPVPGATLQIYRADDENNENVIYENITDETGDLPGLKLTRGKYKFIETHAPVGYKINPNPHFFEVLDDGTIVGSTIMDDEREEYDFELDKVDQHGNKVVGVVFEAKNLLTGETQTVKTDDSGVAKFHGIWSSYEISEKSTPAGYNKSDDLYELQIQPDGSYKRLKVVNEKIEAPETGFNISGMAPIAVLTGSALATGTAVFIRKRR